VRTQTVNFIGLGLCSGDWIDRSTVFRDRPLGWLYKKSHPLLRNDYGFLIFPWTGLIAPLRSAIGLWGGFTRKAIHCCAMIMVF
jgi:hypothetical protein